MGIVKEERIGGQRLILGDSTIIVNELNKHDAIITDPPYGMSFRSNHRSVKHRDIANDEGTDLLKWACSIPFNTSSYIWCRWDNLYDIPKPKSLITWVKNNWSMGDLEHEHGRQTEVCAFYKGDNHKWGNGRPSDVVNAARTGNNYHPTEKPVSLMETVAGWTVGTILDPFMGSGTTLVTCQRMGRKGTGIELDPEYFDIACNRVDEASRQEDLFVTTPTASPEQESLF